MSRSGDGVTVVNRANLEEYLFGVVPRELPPDLFPEIEALKAQALAARTYALTPRDAYLRRGYDLCAGPACQVYGGVAAEHPLSTAAIRQTAGEAIFHDGRLIDALYTASCGGYTENAENVFSNPTPYLVARACIREGGGVRLDGAPADGPLDMALVRLAGAPLSGRDGAGLSGPATREEAAGSWRRWSGGSDSLRANRPPPPGESCRSARSAGWRRRCAAGSRERRRSVPARTAASWPARGIRRSAGCSPRAFSIRASAGSIRPVR